MLFLLRPLLSRRSGTSTRRHSCMRRLLLSEKLTLIEDAHWIEVSYNKKVPYKIMNMFNNDLMEIGDIVDCMIGGGQNLGYEHVKTFE